MIWRIVQLLGIRIAPKLKLILMNKKGNCSAFMTAESFTNGDRFLFITLLSSPCCQLLHAKEMANLIAFVAEKSKCYTV